MIDLGIAALGAFFYFTGQFGMALLLIGLAIVSGVGAVLAALVNPDWYFERRVRAGLDVDFTNPRKGIGALIFTKVIVMGVLLWAARYVAHAGGYL